MTLIFILFALADPILQTVERIQCNKFLYYLINTGHFFKLISLLNDNTVFAPTDEAFDKLSSSTTKRLESDPKYLVSMVMYHIADRRYLSDSFRRTNEIVASRRNGMLMRKRRLFVSPTGVSQNQFFKMKVPFIFHQILQIQKSRPSFHHLLA